jgi:hypothetical protein
MPCYLESMVVCEEFVLILIYILQCSLIATSRVADLPPSDGCTRLLFSNLIVFGTLGAYDVFAPIGVRRAQDETLSLQLDLAQPPRR